MNLKSKKARREQVLSSQKLANDRVCSFNALQSLAPQGSTPLEFAPQGLSLIPVKAFSLAEAMIVLLIGTIALGMSAPMISRQLKNETMNNVQFQVLNKKYEELKKVKSDIPSGAVMYFDLDDCPDGWDELSKKYPNSKNAFIRNIDGTNRALGSLELNAAPEIEGTFDGNTNDESYKRKSGAFYTKNTNGCGADGASGGGTVGFKASKSSAVYGRKDAAGNPATEVRPDNIALLACRKF